MKNFTWIMILMLAFTGQLKAQSDTLTVEMLFQGSPLGAINKQIDGDTTSTGVRKHKVYKLKRGNVYLLNATLKNEGYHLNIVGESGPDNLPPAIIASGVLDDASIINASIIANGDLTVKNVYFKGYVSNTIRQACFIRNKKDASRTVVENCVMEGSQMYTVDMRGDLAKLYFRNNIVRNNIATGGWYNGRGVWIEDVVMDTVVVQNNTFWNLNGYAFVAKGDGAQKYVLFDHNTVANVSTNAIRHYYATNWHVTNNIFFNPQICASTPDELNGNWNDVDQDTNCVFSIDTLPGDFNERYAEFIGTKTEADRVVNFKNNAVFWSPELVAKWNSTSGIARTLVSNVRSLGIFANDTKWPGIYFENAWEQDPQFESNTPVQKILDQFISVRTSSVSIDFGYGFYVNDAGDEVKKAVKWPLPEDLRFKNKAFHNAGTDGKDLGDKRWGYSGPQSVNSESETSSRLACFPNPANKFVRFNIDAPVGAIVSLIVYNSIGKQVAEIVSPTQWNGTMQAEWNFENQQLAKGIYFVSLSIDSSRETQKLIIQ